MPTLRYTRAALESLDALNRPGVPKSRRSAIVGALDELEFSVAVHGRPEVNEQLVFSITVEIGADRRWRVTYREASASEIHILTIEPVPVDDSADM